MTRKELESIIEGTLFNQPIQSGMCLTMYTGRGGVKQFVKSVIEEFKLPYTLTNFIQIYKWLVRTGAVTKNINGGYLIK